MIENLHIELTNRCALKCIECPRTKLGVGKSVDITTEAWPNLSLDKFKSILMCGTFGDAIYHPNITEFFKYVSSTNPDIRLNFSTNGNHKSESWWSELSSILPAKHRIIFALDGVDDETLNKYRVGSNYDNVINNMRIFINNGGTAVWQFILFKHNENQVDEAKMLSDEYGCEHFHLRSSYSYGRDVERPSRKVKTCSELSYASTGPVICRINNNKEIFVDAHGNVIPCCFITEENVKDKLVGNLSFNINNVTLDEVCSEWYLKRITENAKDNIYCNRRCKVPIERLFLS